MLPGTASSTLETLACYWEPPTYIDLPTTGSRCEEAPASGSRSQALGPASHGSHGSQALGPASHWSHGSQALGPPSHGSHGSQALGPASHGSHVEDVPDSESGLARVCILEVMQQACSARQPGRAPVVPPPPPLDKIRAWTSLFSAGQHEQVATTSVISAEQAHHAMVGSAARPAPPPAPEPDPSPLQEQMWHEITATPHFDVETQQQVCSVAD